MTNPSEKPRPWMIAAWPGMGNVAVIAASYLIQELRMTESRDLPPGSFFDVVEVQVKDGLVEPPRLPRGVFFNWKNPGRGRDLVVFVGTAQPSTGSYAYAQALLDEALKLGVERVITFASLASGLHPSENPRVSGVATDADTLAELRRAEVEPVSDGQIGGLNGLILGVAAEREIAGICLLAEIPFFAMNVPNPKAARAALSVFSVLAGVEISLEALDKHAAIVDRALLDAMQRIEQQRADEQEHPAEPTEHDEAPQPEPSPTSELEPGPPEAGRLSQADRDRIEELFEQARKDPNQAMKLKVELDRLDVFKTYEGRFLDLFRRAG